VLNLAGMTPEQFISKWRANARNERAACQEHFIDLCRLLDEPTPNTDPTGATYAFEKGTSKAVGGDGWADVWRRSCFAWEYKGKHKDLDTAHKQLLLYAGVRGAATDPAGLCPSPTKGRRPLEPDPRGMLRTIAIGRSATRHERPVRQRFLCLGERAGRAAARRRADGRAGMHHDCEPRPFRRRFAP
jgi:hypothetical protein